MNKKKLFGAVLSSALVFGAGITTVSADPVTHLESGACVLTLPATMTSINAEVGSSTVVTEPIKSTFITSDMLVCPTGVTPDLNQPNLFTDSEYTGTHYSFSSSSNPLANAYFNWTLVNSYDPVTMVSSQKFGWMVLGSSAIYDSINSTGAYTPKPYVHVLDTGDSIQKNYPLVLAKSFTLVSGNILGSGTCILKLPNLTYHLSDPDGQRNLTVIPGSDLKCPSATVGDTLQIGITLATDQRRAQNVNDSWWVNNRVVNTTTGVIAYGGTMSIYASGLGILTHTTSDSYVRDSTTGLEYQVALAAPVVDKYATDVVAKVKRSGSYLSIKISADRNSDFGFQNGVASYRRQTVMPSEKADRAIVKRGNKVIATVKLSVFGEGKVKIKDIPGMNAYTVTLVATNSNYAGVAAFKK